jgi:hypothetical protein
MRLLILATLSVSCLIGCSTTQERAQKQQVEMDRMIAEFGPGCSKLGYAVNSDPWRNCIVQLAADKGVRQGGVSTSIFGQWGSWGRGAGVGIEVGR